MSRIGGARLSEAGAVGAVGAVLGYATGAAADALLDVSFAAIAGAAVAGVSGAISGWRGIYDWRRIDGPVGFALDSTWSLMMTTAGLFANVVGLAMPGSGYVSDLSERRNVHVYRRGFQTRKGFAITLGNVIGGAGAVERASRRQLIEDHEVVHVWQARWLGPVFPVVYVGWSLAAALYGVAAWATRHRDRPFGKVVESYSYYCNPIEWWAYSRAGAWRPSKMDDECGWRKPMVGPLAQVVARSQALE
jgi:hypothetical protein